MAAAIHKNSDILVTISARAPAAVNPYGDVNLQAQFPDAAAYIDFYSVTYWGEPLEIDVLATGNTVTFFGLDKPAVLITYKNVSGYNDTDLVTRARANGWKGILLWSWLNVFSNQTRGKSQISLYQALISRIRIRHNIHKNKMKYCIHATCANCAYSLCGITFACQGWKRLNSIATTSLKTDNQLTISHSNQNCHEF